MTTITLIGAGNVAHHLFNAFKNCDKTAVTQWYARDLTRLKNDNIEVEFTNNINDLKETDIYIIAVSDDSIEAVAEALPFEKRLVVHTSGSVSLYDINQKQYRGVFYPLQSFSKNVKLDFSEVPICIEALRKEDFKILEALAEALGCKAHKVNSHQRRALHLAAVFANNFTNQIYRIAHEICENKSAEFDILKPLIRETARKLEDTSPYLAQTGPAKRGDKKTIKKHLKMLKTEQHQDIYELMTQSIKDTHGQR